MTAPDGGLRAAAPCREDEAYSAGRLAGYEEGLAATEAVEIDEERLLRALRTPGVMGYHFRSVDGTDGGYAMRDAAEIAPLLAAAYRDAQSTPESAYVDCGMDGCTFAVERGEGRTLAFHRSEEHPLRDAQSTPERPSTAAYQGTFASAKSLACRGSHVPPADRT